MKKIIFTIFLAICTCYIFYNNLTNVKEVSVEESAIHEDLFAQPVEYDVAKQILIDRCPFEYKYNPETKEWETDGPMLSGVAYSAVTFKDGTRATVHHDYKVNTEKNKSDQCFKGDDLSDVENEGEETPKQCFKYNNKSESESVDDSTPDRCLESSKVVLSDGRFYHILNDVMITDGEDTSNEDYHVLLIGDSLDTMYVLEYRKARTANEFILPLN